MIDQEILRAAAERAAVGVGYPHEIVWLRRRGDDRGWVVGFNDVSFPERLAVFEAEVADDATPDDVADTLMQAMKAHQVEAGPQAD